MHCRVNFCLCRERTPLTDQSGISLFCCLGMNSADTVAEPNYFLSLRDTVLEQPAEFIPKQRKAFKWHSTLLMHASPYPHHTLISC